MQIYRRLAAIVLSAALCVSLAAGCGKADVPEPAEEQVLSVCVGAAPESLDPIYAEDVTDQTILAHLYENLMRISVNEDGTTSVVNGMAEEVEQEENLDGTVTYTFRLREAEWSDGKPVTAENFVYAWRRLASPISKSPYTEMLSVVCGYAEARASRDMSLLQVVAEADDTLVVTLNGNYDWFLTQVCTSPVAMPLREDVLQSLKERVKQAIADGEAEESARWWKYPTFLVTNGPYTATEYEEGMSLQLQVNEHYYGYGERSGPTELNIHFAATAEEGQALYDAETVDVLWPLTETRLEELAADETWTAIPDLSTYTVLFNTGKDFFGDNLIREAMNMVIDRNGLAAAAGITARPAEGLVPHGVPENEEGDFRTLGGPELDNDPALYEEACAQAKRLLSSAGYESGLALGEIELLYVEEGTNGDVARLLCRQWLSKLQIRVIPRGVTEQEAWAALRSGRYELAAVALTADGNDAECFLSEWTTDSQNNVVLYGNSAYDALMAVIAHAPDGTARMGCLHDAEELLLGDHVLAPLFTKGTDWTLRENLTGAYRDLRGWFCFADVCELPEQK